MVRVAHERKRIATHGIEGEAINWIKLDREEGVVSDIVKSGWALVTNGML